MSNGIIELLLELDPIRQIADVESISEGDTWTGLKEGTTAFGGGWVAERATRPETTAGTFEEDKIPTHEMYANPFVTQKQIDDVRFNIQQYAAMKIARKFASLEGVAFVEGNGITKPLGFLSALPGGTAVGTVAGGQSATIDTDDMLSLKAALPEEYARSAGYLMRRATKFVVRKLKDGNGQYLWQPSLQIGTPPTFDGDPVIESPTMPAVGASAKSVVYADWKRFYKIIDRAGIVTRPDPFTNKPYVELYTTKRTGGQVRLPEAGKILVCGA
jgi:HK97 family phage major capsid protein